jgi:hypothetical protein
MAEIEQDHVPAAFPGDRVQDRFAGCRDVRGPIERDTLRTS